MSLPPATVTGVATHGGTNAMVAVVLAAYLAIVLYQGNLGSLATAAKQDFLGGNNEKPFWRWAAALLILLALAHNPKLNFLFGPALVFVLIAMLINTAQNQPDVFANLNQGVATFFGFGQGSASTSPTQVALANTGNSLPSSNSLPAASASSSSSGGLLGGLGGLLGGGSAGNTASIAGDTSALSTAGGAAGAAVDVGSFLF